MFGQRKVISTVKVMPVTSPPNSMAAVVQTKSILKTANDICTSPKTEKEEPLSDWIYVPENKPQVATSLQVAPPIISAVVASNAVQTYRIGKAFQDLRESIISRGCKYQNNSLASRRGYIAENFTADTYNIDAVIKKSSDRAFVPESNKNASADIVYKHGKKQASLKYYKDAESSARAQTNPDYKNQTRVVPSDQVSDGKNYLNQLANRNEMKGRVEAAETQRSTADLLEGVIKNSDENVQSMPLTRKNSDALAKSFDRNGVHEANLDKALKNTGVVQKVRRAKMMNELQGIGISTAIGLGTGFAIGIIVSLAQNGLNPNSLKYAFISGAQQGANSAVLAGTGAILSAAIRPATETLADIACRHLYANAAAATTEKIAMLCNMTIIGSLTIVAFSVYEFVKLKIQGYSTKECLLRVGKTAALSFSLLIISVVAQGVWGGPVGIVVSIAAGVIVTGCTVMKIRHDKRVYKDVTFYSIELCKPILSIA